MGIEYEKKSSSKIFKIDFDMKDYKDILPNWNEYLKHDEIINATEFEKGNIDNCIWQKYKPSISEIGSQEYRQREARRILKTGAWVVIKSEICWLPPSYYFALQYGKTGGIDMQFRLKRLKHVYFKLRARNNAQCKGTFTVKNRQDGETSMAISDAFWETFEMEDGQIGIQSKTREDAINPCWKTLQTLWMNLPTWLKDDLCSDFASGKNIAETMKFMRDADERDGISARNVLLAYYPSVYNAMDGKNQVKKAILDEVLKWINCNFGDTLNNYSKFIMPGFERRGMFDIFSSPPEKDCQSYRDGYELWLKSDPNDIEENGTTKSRIHRYYSNPLEGIQGAYDRFGDADPEIIYDWIMKERDAQPKSKKLEEIRGFPLNDEEIWGSMETTDFWDNSKGIEARKVYLIGTRFKNDATKEPKVVYGNLEWEDGIPDTNPVFRQSDKENFDVKDARFCFSFMPQNREALKNIFIPPSYVENCLGIDSVDKRYPGKRASNVAMVNHKFRDLFGTGIVKCPTMIYSNRPTPVEISYEDAIKAMIFNRSMVQVESLNLNIVNWMEDRGYIKWVLSKIGEGKDSVRKGDAPSGKSAFIDEIVGLINAITNVPLPNSGEPYLLEKNWHYELLEDVSVFNKKDTHKNDLSMAWGQSLLGCAKILHERAKKPSRVNDSVLNFLLN